jgi:hypothetical protein
MIGRMFIYAVLWLSSPAFAANDGVASKTIKITVNNRTPNVALAAFIERMPAGSEESKEISKTRFEH